MIGDGSWTKGSDFDIRLWDVKAGKELRRLTGHTEGINALAFSTDNTKLLSCASDKSIRLWDVQTGKQLKLLEGHKGSVTGVAFSKDGTRAVSGSWDGSVKLWDATTEPGGNGIAPELPPAPKTAAALDGPIGMKFVKESSKHVHLCETCAWVPRKRVNVRDIAKRAGIAILIGLVKL